MGKIYDTRRVFYEEPETVYEYKWVKNPAYNRATHEQYAQAGWRYPIDEYIEKEIPKTVIRERSHIEYLIQCAHCGTKKWKRRRDAIYCSGNCRKLAHKYRGEEE